MFESLSHRKKDLYDEPSPLNSLNPYPYQRIGRTVEGSKNMQSVDLTLSEHDLERARPDKPNQNIFQALALALGSPMQEEHNVLGNVRSELSELMSQSHQRLPLRLQELRARKDLWMKIIDNPSQEEYHKVGFSHPVYLRRGLAGLQGQGGRVFGVAQLAGPQRGDLRQPVQRRGAHPQDRLGSLRRPPTQTSASR